MARSQCLHQKTRIAATQSMRHRTKTLYDAFFLAFDGDKDARLAVSTGTGGTFCGGAADLKGGRQGRSREEARRSAATTRSRPMGPEPAAACSKAVIRGSRGLGGWAGGMEAGAVGADMRVVAEGMGDRFGHLLPRFGVALDRSGHHPACRRLIAIRQEIDLIRTGTAGRRPGGLSLGGCQKPPGAEGGEDPCGQGRWRWRRIIARFPARTWPARPGPAGSALGNGTCRRREGDRGPEMRGGLEVNCLRARRCRARRALPPRAWTRHGAFEGGPDTASPPVPFWGQRFRGRCHKKCVFRPRRSRLRLVAGREFYGE